MTTKHRIKIHEIAEAQFEPDAIGTYVDDPESMMELLDKALDTYEFPESGKGFITLPEHAILLASPGVAKRSGLNDLNSVIREYRGRKDVYINRESLTDVADKVSIVIYTKWAYLQDAATEERASLAAELGVNTSSLSMALAGHLDIFVKGLKEELADIDYVWVTTIASIGLDYEPANDPPVSPYRFACNLANKDYVEDDMASAILDVAIDEAGDSIAYWGEWVVVSTPKQDSPVYTCDECGSRL